MKNKPKAEWVLDTALDLLKDQGDYGVTMRQVAANAGMSLGHVQYYFKNKNDLLKAMADRYFKACLEEMRKLKNIQPGQETESELYALLSSFLQHGFEMSEMCRIFREYWAISTRNAVIDKHIKQYYQDMAEILSDILRPISQSDDGLSKAVSIIIPYVEGYSITAQAMPANIDALVDELTGFVLSILYQ